MDVLLSQTISVFSNNQEVIHDVAFNHYGNRMATCSSDQLIKVWDKNLGNEWKKSGEWKAHNDSALKITWAHPEFGQVLATCSVDRSVAVWEELYGCDIVGQNWVRKAILLDSKTSVIDIKFAPKSLGLFLAACSLNGSIRIYKAPDVLNLSLWSLQQEVNCGHQASCFSWNPNYISDCYSIKYFKMNNSYKKDGLNVDNINNLYAIHPPDVEEPNSYIVVPQDPMLVIGFDDEDCKPSDKIVILQYNLRLRRWYKTEFAVHGAEHCMSSNGPVHDLSVAARLGRTYDLLAVAAKDIIIYAFYQIFNPSFSTFKFKLCQIACFADHNSSVWRIKWNSIGTALVTSGSDKCIRLWKQHWTLFNKEYKNSTLPTKTFPSQPRL